MKEIHEKLDEEHGVPVDDHLDQDEEVLCGYCGRAFMGSESRIEKTIFGRKWVFCNDECLENFRDKADYVDPDADMMIEKEDTGFEVNMSFTGPDIDDE